VEKSAQFVSVKSGGTYSRIISVFLRVQHTKPNKQIQGILLENRLVPHLVR